MSEEEEYEETPEEAAERRHRELVRAIKLTPIWFLAWAFGFALIGVAVLAMIGVVGYVAGRS